MVCLTTFTYKRTQKYCCVWVTMHETFNNIKLPEKDRIVYILQQPLEDILMILLWTISKSFYRETNRNEMPCSLWEKKNSYNLFNNYKKFKKKNGYILQIFYVVLGSGKK